MKARLTLTLGAALCLQAAAQVDSDPYFGDWVGKMNLNGTEQSVCVCMIPRGDSHYEARFFRKFGEQDTPLQTLVGSISGGTFKFIEPDVLKLENIKRPARDGIVLDATLWQGPVTDDKKVTGRIAGKENGTFTLEKTVRTSPTMGLKPPKGAIVLFDGTNTDAFHEIGNNNPIRWVIKDGALEVAGGDIAPRQGFADCTLHIEFRSPYITQFTGQLRGNSGVYVNGAYELQILDSYGLPGLDNDCGGLYQVARPLVNACFPPTYWQTYDIDFTAPRFDADGRKVANGRMTVKLNGITIHDNVELPRATAGATNPTERDIVGLRLQDHGDNVQFRNIWALEK